LIAKSPILVLLLFLAAVLPSRAQSLTPLQVVTAMVKNEKQARQDRTYYRYISFERSARTDGHLWKEYVAETPEGLLRRLIAEDGKPLTAARAAEEDERISKLVGDPANLEAANADRRADEARLGRLLDVLPQALLFSAAGVEDECTRIAFRPNPAFAPSTYDERIVNRLAGTILIHEPDNRLCGIQGHLVDRVTFGFGLLGHLDQDSHFAVTRVPVTPTDWKSTRIDVHLDGKILLLKSISRNEEAVHSEHQQLPPHLPLAQAAALTRP
jgi:hypothetical protein